MYNLSPKIKLYSIVLIVLGLIMFGAGYMINHGTDKAEVEQMMNTVHGSGEHHQPVNSAEMVGPQDHAAHLEHAMHMVHNEPMAALLTAAMLFFGISTCALFFLTIQHVGNVGWSVIVIRVMEAVASYIPVGGVIMLIIVVLNITHQAHLYHWMDGSLVDPKSPNFDVILFEKSKFLNIPFFTVRSLIYVAGAVFFVFKLKSLSKKLDETKSRKDYQLLKNWSVGYIAFFGLASAAWAWDWLMSIDPHWYSTLYIWYAMSSALTSAIAVIIIVSVYLKKNNFLPEFNDNHLHDLAKYLFATSMLWSYFWFSQYMLAWYANVPEEVNYFLGRFDFYQPTFLPMLIPNFLIPLLVMVSSSIKRNYNIVVAMAVIVILGHWVDHFNMVFPGTVGPYWNFGLLEFGAFFFIVGLFALTVMTALSKLKLIPEGHPLLHESKIFEYPF